MAGSYIEMFEETYYPPAFLHLFQKTKEAIEKEQEEIQEMIGKGLGIKFLFRAFTEITKGRDPSFYFRNNDFFFIHLLLFETASLSIRLLWSRGTSIEG